MVDPSLFRSSFTSSKLSPSEFGKNQKVAIFFQQVLNIDQHSYQRFFPKLHN
jgi:hypothetical protein